MGSGQIGHTSAGGVSRERSDTCGVCGGVSSITVTAAEVSALPPGGAWAWGLRRAGREASRERLDMPVCSCCLGDTFVGSWSTQPAKSVTKGPSRPGLGCPSGGGSPAAFPAPPNHFRRCSGLALGRRAASELGRSADRRCRRLR